MDLPELRAGLAEGTAKGRVVRLQLLDLSPELVADSLRLGAGGDQRSLEPVDGVLQVTTGGCVSLHLVIDGFLHDGLPAVGPDDERKCAHLGQRLRHVWWTPRVQQPRQARDHSPDLHRQVLPELVVSVQRGSDLPTDKLGALTGSERDRLAKCRRHVHQRHPAEPLGCQGNHPAAQPG